MSGQDLFKVANSLIIEKLNEDTYLYINPNLPSWVRVDINGHNLINRLNGKKTIDLIIEDIAIEYNVNKEHIENDIISFYSEISKREIIQTQESQDCFKTKYKLERVIFPSDVSNGNFSEVCNIADKKISSTVEFVFFIDKEARNIKDITQIIERLSMDRKVQLAMDYNLINRSDLKQLSTSDKINSFNILFNISNSDEISLERNLISLNSIVQKHKCIEVSIYGNNDINNMRELYRIANENNVNRINIGHCYSCDDNTLKIGATEITNSMMEEMFDIYISSRILLPIVLRRELNHTHLNFTGMNYRSLFITGIAYSNCGLGTKIISINEHGNIFPCPSLSAPEFSLGNILTDSFSDVQQKTMKYNEIRCDDPVCRDCELDCFCDNGCRSDAYKNFGRLSAIDPSCKIRKKVMWKIMKDWNVIKSSNN